MKKLSKEDYIIWDTLNDCPKERLSVIYHYTSIVEFMNSGFKLNPNEEIRCMTDLSTFWQTKYTEAINTK